MLPRIVARAFVAVTVCVASSVTQAGSIGVTLGTGPDGFDSRGLDFGFAVGKLPLNLNAGYYMGSSNGSISLEQANAGLDWQVSKSVSLQLGASRIDDDVFIVEGGDIGLGVRLNPLWDGKRVSFLNLGVGRMDYTPDTRLDLPGALLDRVPEQKRYGIGLTQGLTDNLTLNLNYDAYDYTEDPKELAIAVARAFIKRGRYPPNSAFSLLAFPDNAYNIGLNWDVSEGIGLNVSFGETETVLSQKLRSLSFGVTHYGEYFNTGLNLTRSFSTEVTGERGFTILPSSDDIYVDFRLSKDF